MVKFYVYISPIFSCQVTYVNSVDVLIVTSHTDIDTNGVGGEGSLQSSCNTSYILTPDNNTCISNNTECVYMISEPSGSINTDGFPTIPYAPNSNCTWIIDLASIQKH